MLSKSRIVNIFRVFLQIFAFSLKRICMIWICNAKRVLRSLLMQLKNIQILNEKILYIYYRYQNLHKNCNHYSALLWIRGLSLLRILIDLVSRTLNISSWNFVELWIGYINNNYAGLISQSEFCVYVHSLVDDHLNL